MVVTCKCGDSRQRLSDGFACMVALAAAAAAPRDALRWEAASRLAKGQGGGKRGATENQLSLSMALVRFGGSEVRSLRQVLVFGSEQLENRATVVVALDRLRGERAYVWGKPEAVIPSIFFSFRRSIFFIEKLLPIFSTTAHTHHQRTERNRFFF